MGAVVIHKSISLDGFVTGPNVSVEHPMGVGGLRLHAWLFDAADGGADARFARELHETTGAVVLGRRTFDVGFGVWNDTPFAAPCFVVTRRTNEPIDMPGGRFEFIDHLPRAIERARVAAGERNVCLMGAETSRNALDAGLVDELRLQIVPVLLGGGTRLFDALGSPSLELIPTTCETTPSVTHMHYRVPRG